MLTCSSKGPLLVEARAQSSAKRVLGLRIPMQLPLHVHLLIHAQCCGQLCESSGHVDLRQQLYHTPMSMVHLEWLHVRHWPGLKSQH